MGRWKMEEGQIIFHKKIKQGRLGVIFIACQLIETQWIGNHWNLERLSKKNATSLALSWKQTNLKTQSLVPQLLFINTKWNHIKRWNSKSKTIAEPPHQ